GRISRDHARLPRAHEALPGPLRPVAGPHGLGDPAGSFPAVRGRAPLAPGPGAAGRPAWVRARFFSREHPAPAARSEVGIAALSRFAGAVGVETGGRRALVPAGQPLQ